MHTITISGERQPRLFRQLLQSLVANDLTGWRIFIQIDPTPLGDQYVRTAAELLGCFDYTLSVNPRYLGARGNSFRLLERAFEQGSKLNINLAEDTLVAADVTRLARWYAGHHRPEWLCLSLASLVIPFRLASDITHADLLFPGKEFNASGFVVRREEWYGNFEDKNFRGECLTSRLDDDLLVGWQWSVCKHLLQTDALVSLQPATPRSTPAIRAENGGDEKSNRPSLVLNPGQLIDRHYRVVSLRELPECVQTQIPVQDVLGKLLGAIADREQIIADQKDTLAEIKRAANERVNSLSFVLAKVLVQGWCTLLPTGSWRQRIWNDYVRRFVKRLVTRSSAQSTLAPVRAMRFPQLPRLVSSKETPVRILILKLDHIGDLLLSVHALSLLREAWPYLHLTLVCGPWNVKLSAQLALFDEIHAYNFFSPRSGDGLNAGIRDFRQLPLGTYDLAIDLRHDTDTRPVLNLVRAKYRAGFVCDPQFPVPLDLALPDVERVSAIEAPRNPVHSEVRLITLVSTIIATFGQYKGSIAQSLVGPRPLIRYFDQGPVVGLAPGTGNPIKQWGVERFSRVARALNTEAGCRFVLIGGEADKADASLIAATLPPDQCINAAGKHDISDVPLALAAMDLFIGNDTGTTHMAALLGIPTIDIFSGVVDINVWCAKGPNVVTLYAPVPCAPCRLGKRGDCSYGLACLTSISEDDVVTNALLLLYRSGFQHPHYETGKLTPREQVTRDAVQVCRH
jgi:ADP-heptose:LPS heptosyltransferase